MPLSSRWLAAISIFLIAAMLLVGLMSGPKNIHWIVIMILMIVFLITLGIAINGRPLGVLIDERKVMSLSRLQIIIWTVILLSAYFTIASARIHAGVVDPLAIKLDWQLWALMGISSASLVGTPLIISQKKAKAIAQTETYKGVEKDQIEGIVFVNRENKDAKFTDMFEGDEVKNQGHIDMSKVQMFFFTIISALSYIALLFNMLSVEPSNIAKFPEVSEGLLAILAISHSAYLANKGIDHTATDPSK